MNKNLKWFLDNQKQLCKKHCGKYLAIVECAVVGVYDDRGSAHRSTRRDHEPGTFIIQHCIPGDKAHKREAGLACAITRTA